MNKTYGIEPRMDGDAAQKLAWRVLALSEALKDVTTMTEAKTPAYETARNALAVDADSMRLSEERLRKIAARAEAQRHNNATIGSPLWVVLDCDEVEAILTELNEHRAKAEIAAADLDAIVARGGVPF